MDTLKIMLLLFFKKCLRIYNTLPEVKKKQEEKQKQVVLQSNRLRVEMFKKVMILQ